MIRALKYEETTCWDFENDEDKNPVRSVIRENPVMMILPDNEAVECSYNDRIVVKVGMHYVEFACSEWGGLKIVPKPPEWRD